MPNVPRGGRLKTDQHHTSQERQELLPPVGQIRQVAWTCHTNSSVQIPLTTWSKTREAGDSLRARSTLSRPNADMMKLELDLHGLREETSAHVERKDKEVIILQRRLQELQVQLTETQKLGLNKDKVR